MHERRRERGLDPILDDLVRAATPGEPGPLAHLVIELCGVVARLGDVPDAFAGRIGTLLDDPAFLAAPESWRLASCVDICWDALSVPQREALRGPLARAFDAFPVDMGAYAVAELLGRRFADAGALEALLRLSNTARMPARALVPHGLGVLARRTGDPALAARALARLRELAGAAVEPVGEVARRALSRAAPAVPGVTRAS